MSLRRGLKNVVLNHSACEREVREATSNDACGAPTSLLNRIADNTFDLIKSRMVMGMMWKRMGDHTPKYWRHVYKSLQLCDFLVKHGATHVVDEVRQNLFQLQSLRDFQYIKEGQDYGLTVRQKAKDVLTLLGDEGRLAAEREKAQLLRERLRNNISAIGSTMPPSRGGKKQAKSAHTAFENTMHSVDGEVGNQELNSPPVDRPTTPLGYERPPSSEGPYSAATAAASPPRAAVGPRAPGGDDAMLALAMQVSVREAQEKERVEMEEEMQLAHALEMSRRESGVGADADTEHQAPWVPDEAPSGVWGSGTVNVVQPTSSTDNPWSSPKVVRRVVVASASTSSSANASPEKEVAFNPFLAPDAPKVNPFAKSRQSNGGSADDNPFGDNFAQ